MYNTIVTSDLGELVARSYGVDVEKTLTGFKFIGDKIRKYEQTHEKTFVFGSAGRFQWFGISKQ